MNVAHAITPKTAIDVCDFCGTHFRPLSSETTCVRCGAPRARWESYRPAIVSDDYVLSRDGRSYGSREEVIAAGAIVDVTLAVNEPVSIEEIAFPPPCGIEPRIHALRIGELSFMGRPALLSRLVLANLRTVLRDRVLLPSVPLVATLQNRSAAALGYEVDIVAVPLGDRWESFVKCHAGKGAAS